MPSLLLTRSPARATFAVVACALVAYSAYNGFGIGGASLEGVFSPTVYGPLLVLAGVASLLRGVSSPDDRFPLVACGVALVSWAAAAVHAGAAPEQVPAALGLTPNELGLLACYISATAGLAVFLYRRAPATLRGLWVEFVVVLLGVSSLWAAVVLPAALDAGRGLPVLQAVVYPIVDVTILASVLGSLLVGRREAVQWWVASIALCVLATADALLAGHVAGAAYAAGVLDQCWPLVTLLVALGTLRPAAERPADGSLTPTGCILVLSGLAAVAVLVVDHHHRLTAASVTLAGLTLGTVVLRFTTRLGAYGRALDESRRAQCALTAETRRLRESEARVREAHRIGRLATWEWDVQRDELHFTGHLGALLGTDIPQGAPASVCAELLHPADREPMMQAMRRAVQDGAGFELQVRAVRRGGGWSTCHVRANAGRSADGGMSLFGTAQDVTEDVRRRAALREAEQRLHHAFEHAPIGKGIVAMDGRWLEANRALCKLLGYSRDELLQRDIHDLTHPDDAIADRRALEEFRSGRRHAFQVEKRYRRADGRMVWAQVNVSCVRHQGDEPDYLVTQVQDITARRRSEARLRDAEQRFRLAFEEAPIGIALVSLDGRRLSVNRAYCEMFGYSAEELLGRESAALVHPDDVEEHRDVIRRALAGELIAPRERRSIDRAGNVVWVQARTTLVRDADGEPLYFVSQLVDVTERKRADAARKHLAAIVESSHDAIVATDRDGMLTSWNPGAESLYGYRAEEVLGRSIDVLSPSDLVDEARGLRAGVMAGEPVEHYETQQRRADGTTLAVSLTKSPIRDDDGQIVGVSTIARDITERLAAQREIEQLLADQHAILASAGEGIYRVDADGRITFVNPSAAAMLGWEPGELLGRLAHETLHHSHADRTAQPCEGCAVHRCLLNGEVARAAAETFWRRDGSSFTVDWTIAPIRERDRTAGAVVVFRDVSEQLAAEEERLALQQRLRQLERLDTVGKLASGIAHDFNNLIAVITTYAALLADDVQDERLRADVEQIRNAARSAAELTRQLLIFGRRDVARVEPVDLNALVRSTEDLLRRTLGARTTLRSLLDPALSCVVADRTQLEQLVMNLVINARDAMPDGGTLDIQTTDVELAAGAVPGLAAGGYVRLSVRDSGCGMDADVVAHAFEPFFTTKPAGAGTGLGLTTVYGIATKAGGMVELDSEPGRGTTVTVLLPASRAASGAADPRAPQPPSGSTLPFREVVVVEDSDRVRQATTKLLRRRGLEVSAVASGDEALELFRCGHAADVLLTDVVMPGLTGPQLADELHRIRPGLPMVFMTGYSDDAALTAESAICISKPFDEAQLLDALELAVISAPAAG